MTAKQIAWAAQHDWFIADNGDGSITAIDAYDYTLTVRHDDFKALREWAGY